MKIKPLDEQIVDDPRSDHVGFIHTGWIYEAMAGFIFALDNNVSEKRRIIEFGKIISLFELYFGKLTYWKMTKY